jgi:hypothetical protein
MIHMSPGVLCIAFEFVRSRVHGAGPVERWPP